jgi:hypothetical protein
MFPLPQQTIYNMTIYPGDLISARVEYLTSGFFAGDYLLSITDESRPNDSFSTIQPRVANTIPQRNSAEWIVENGLSHPVYFANATATIDGMTGTIGSPYWQSQALNLGGYGQPIASSTSIVLNAGDAFVVNPVGTSGGNVPNVMAAEPSQLFYGPDLTTPAAQERPRAAAANAPREVTAASDFRPTSPPATAVDLRGANPVVDVHDASAGRTNALRPRPRRRGSQSAY